MPAEDRTNVTGRIYRFDLHEGCVPEAARAHLLAWSTNKTKRDAETETRLIAEEQKFMDDMFQREDRKLRQSLGKIGAGDAAAAGGGGGVEWAKMDPYARLPRPGQGPRGSWPAEPLPPPQKNPPLFQNRSSGEM